MIQSVQGSFDFLQDSQIELGSISPPKPSSTTAAGVGVGVNMEPASNPSSMAPSSTAPAPSSTSGLLGVGPTTAASTSSSIGAAVVEPPSISSSLSAAFHDASPMIDDPAVMHVTAGVIMEDTLSKCLSHQH